jgi:hypothetical protein
MRLSVPLGIYFSKWKLLGSPYERLSSKFLRFGSYSIARVHTREPSSSLGFSNIPWFKYENTDKHALLEWGLI